MSDSRIPLSNGDLKPLSLGDIMRLTKRTNKYVERVNAELAERSPDFPLVMELYIGPGAKTDKTAKPPRRQRPEADPASYSPIEHTLYSLQAFGFTHPSHGHFLMVPKEFQAILLLETKAVAAGVWEVMQQTIGWEDGRAGGRREWVHLTVRYFEREQLLSRNHAEKGLARALVKGYIERRPMGHVAMSTASAEKGQIDPVENFSWCPP
jgi:hypothetical protein